MEWQTKVLAGFIGMGAMENQEAIIEMANDLSIDAKKGSRVKTEATKAARPAQRAQVNPEDIPDAPEMVQAGVHDAPVESDVSESENGLSGPGSYEAAMMLFGPKTINVPNPHGTHEVTEDG